jgi:hypothetical protein
MFKADIDADDVGMNYSGQSGARRTMLVRATHNVKTMAYCRFDGDVL